MKKVLSGKMIPRVGLGCMGMSEFYGPVNDDQSSKALQKAFDLGFRHFDTADMYGFGHNESLIGLFINQLGQQRQNIVVATKVGIQRERNNLYKLSVNASKSYIKESCNNSLRRLQTDYIDLYYLHRIDPNRPVEESIEALQELLNEGKIKSVGLCETSAETIKKFHAMLPVEAVQSEYSLWTRDIESSVLPTCEELGISVVAFSPLGRGFLAGQIGRDFMSKADSELDFRARLPRFNNDNIDKNLALLKHFQDLCQKIGVTPSQMALAWILNKSKSTFIIPGTKKEQYLLNNFSAEDITLEATVMANLNEMFVASAVHGSRYPADILAHSNA